MDEHGQTAWCARDAAPSRASLTIAACVGAVLVTVAASIAMMVAARLDRAPEPLAAAAV